MICAMECDDDFDTRHIRVLPDACVELFISYTGTPVAIIGNELYKRSIITFRMSRPMDVQMRKGSGCLAVCFYPGMANKFFHLPMHLLSDTTTELLNVWHKLASEIEDKIAGARNNEDRVYIIQEQLLRQLSQTTDDKQMSLCLSTVRSSIEKLSVKQLTEKTGLSQRHLSRKFQEQIGLSPKEFIRVSRFIKSLKHLKREPKLHLTAVAYDSGYYDQAHFIRDYKTFAGLTPGELLRSSNILY